MLGNILSNGTAVGAAVWDDGTAAITGLSPNTTYYFNIIATIEGIQFRYTMTSVTTLAAPDTTAPVLTAGAVNRTSDTEATVRFTSDEAGQYYYAVVEEGSDEPFIDTSGEGTACTAGETTITNPTGLSAGAKDIYVKVKDASGNVSGALKMDIDAYTSEGKPFIISSDGVLDRTEGIKAVAEVELVPGTDTHTGNEVVVFELMKGSTPVSIIAVEKDIASKETFTAYFNVDDPQNGAYTVRVFVLDTFDSVMTAPISLAEPADLD